MQNQMIRPIIDLCLMLFFLVLYFMATLQYQRKPSFCLHNMQNYVLEEHWKRTLGIFVHTDSLHAVSHHILKPSEGCKGHRCQIWKWVVCGYTGMHIIKAMLSQPASFGWWPVGLMCHKKTSPCRAVTPASPLCPVDTSQEGCVDLWCARFWPYHLPFAGRILQVCSVYPIWAIQFCWSCVNYSLCFLFSAGTKLLCSGLGKVLGRAAYNTTDNRFILTTECLLFIFSYVTNLEMTIEFDFAVCNVHMSCD